MSVAYSNKTETKQDAIGVEVFTNTVGDAAIVQKLLEQQPHTLTQAYDFAAAMNHRQRHMLPGACSMTERRPRVAVIREGAEEDHSQQPAGNLSPLTPHIQHAFPELNYTPQKQMGHKDIKW